MFSISILWMCDTVVNMWLMFGIWSNSVALGIGFGVSRIEPLCSPACRKRRLIEASRGLPAGAIPSVVKV